MIAAALAGAAAFMIVPVAVDASISFFRVMAARARIRAGRAATADGKRTGDGAETVPDLADRAMATLEVLLEGGLASLESPTRKALSFRGAKRLAGEVTHFAQRWGIRASAEGALQTLTIGWAACTLLFCIITNHLFLAAMLATLVTAIACQRISAANKARIREAEDALPDALRALGVYYSSGLGLLRSLEHVADDYPGPLGDLFGEIASSMRAGKSMEESLERMRDFGSGSLSFLGVAMMIQQRTGGQLQPILDRVAGSVSESIELRRSLEVKTAQARMSARIVAVMPIVVFSAVALMNPSSVIGFFSSTMGLGLFVLACVMEVAGILVIRRILDVDVG